MPSPDHTAPSPARRILLVEDDRAVRDVATLVLERVGFTVHAVDNGVDAAREATRPAAYDLMVLDLMLPGLHGIEVCRRVRQVSTVPIVVLTAQAADADVVACLELGADDYITKPFTPAVLAARVRAVLRRVNPQPDTQPLCARDLLVDETSFRAECRGGELALTTTEFRLLAELLREPGAVLSREVLVQRVWGYGYLGDSRLVDMAIMRLREKLGEPASPPPYITTVRGVGYRLDP